MIFLVRQEVVYKFANKIRKAVCVLSKYLYMIYLSHVILLENFVTRLDLSIFSEVWVYLGCIGSSFLFGIGMYYLELVCERFSVSFFDKKVKR